MGGRRKGKLNDALMASRMSLKILAAGGAPSEPQEVLQRAVNHIAVPTRAMVAKGEADEARAALNAAKSSYDGPAPELWARTIDAVVEQVLPSPAS